MANLTQVIVVTSMRLHGRAWQTLLQDEAFLDVLGVMEEPDQESLPIDEDKPLAILFDELNPVPARAQQLAAAWSNAGSLFLMNDLDPDQMAAFIAAGASGFLTREAEASDLTRALIAVGRGELALPSELAGQVLRQLAERSGGSQALAEQLTDREQEVLVQLAQGMTNKEIAQSLMISVRTVEAHLRSIYGKLEVSSRTEAALWAVNHDFDQ